MTYEEISSARYVDARNEQIKKDFNQCYSGLRATFNEVSFLAIYNQLAMAHGLSVSQVRRIIKGYK